MTASSKLLYAFGVALHQEMEVPHQDQVLTMNFDTFAVDVHVFGGNT